MTSDTTLTVKCTLDIQIITELCGAFASFAHLRHDKTPQLTCVEYNISSIIKYYGNKFNFLQQHVGGEKLEDKQRLSESSNMQLWSRKKLPS